jgi:hypothetical protein
MNAKNLLCALALLFATAAISADQGTISGSVNGVEISKPQKAAPTQDKSTPPKHSTCLSQCAANEQRCSREVRLARTECQRVAANNGRDPFTGRQGGYDERHLDYSDFCGYFAHPGSNCASGYYSNSCRRRLQYRHGICLTAMRNIASMRYDCYRAEKDANTECRADLSSCKAACE